MVTAIFGGSFDPPHLGHLLAMRAVLSLGKSDDIIMVPCIEHPFGKGAASFEDRLEMCRLMAGAEMSGKVTVSDIEKRMNLSGRTLDTIRSIKEDLPDRTLRFLVGADILEERDRWHKFEEIERLAPLIVVGRGDGQPAGGGDALLPVSDISSSSVRERIGRGLDCSLLVPPSVLAYIKEKGLYK